MQGDFHSFSLIGSSRGHASLSRQDDANSSIVFRQVGDLQERMHGIIVWGQSTNLMIGGVTKQAEP